MNCQKCGKPVAPPEAAEYRGICEDCWVQLRGVHAHGPQTDGPAISNRGDPFLGANRQHGRIVRKQT